MGGHLAGYALRIVSSLIMTRLLVPDMFGIMAVATIVHMTIGQLSDVGLRPAILQSARGESPALLDTAWSLQVLRGILIWLGCVCFSIAVSQVGYLHLLPETSVYLSPELPVIIVAFTFTSVVHGFQSMKATIHDRNLDQGKLTLIELYGQISGLIVAMVLGAATRSIWSFVAGAWVATSITVWLSHVWLPGARNRFRMEREAVKELLLFGRWIWLSSISSMLAWNGDRILLGAWLTPAQLGVYILAFNLMAMVEGAGSRLIHTVAAPALSKVVRESPQRFCLIYYKIRIPSDLIFIACAGILFSAGPAIIELLYDHRYVGAGEILRILSISLLISRYGINTAVYIAVGNSKNLGSINLLKALSLFCLTPLAYYFFGFEAALWAIALHALPTVPFQFWLNRRYHLNNAWFETGILLVWIAGYLVGLAIAAAVDWLRHSSAIL